MLAEAAALQAALVAGIAEDAAAFAQVMAVMRDKSLDDLAKAEAMEAATIVACEVPLRMARLSRDAGRLGRTITAIGNVNATSDACSGGRDGPRWGPDRLAKRQDQRRQPWDQTRAD